MNARTVKLINLVAADKRTARVLKQAWRNLPWYKRYATRQTFVSHVSQGKQITYTNRIV